MQSERINSKNVLGVYYTNQVIFEKTKNDSKEVIFRQHSMCLSFISAVSKMINYLFSVCLTCREGGEGDPVVERLCGAVVVLQQHPVWIFGFAGVKYRLHLQQLEWRGEEEKDGKKVLRLKQKVSD